MLEERNTKMRKTHLTEAGGVNNCFQEERVLEMCLESWARGPGVKDGLDIKKIKKYM